MQGCVANLRNAFRWQESFHLIKKRSRGRIFSQLVASLFGLCLDIRRAVVGEFSSDNISVDLSI